MGQKGIYIYGCLHGHPPPPHLSIDFLQKCGELGTTLLRDIRNILVGIYMTFGMFTKIFTLFRISDPHLRFEIWPDIGAKNRKMMFSRFLETDFGQIPKNVHIHISPNVEKKSKIFFVS